MMKPLLMNWLKHFSSIVLQHYKSWLVLRCLFHFVTQHTTCLTLCLQLTWRGDWAPWATATLWTRPWWGRITCRVPRAPDSSWRNLEWCWAQRRRRLWRKPTNRSPTPPPKPLRSWPPSSTWRPAPSSTGSTITGELKGDTSRTLFIQSFPVQCRNKKVLFKGHSQKHPTTVSLYSINELHRLLVFSRYPELYAKACSSLNGLKRFVPKTA